MKSLYHKLAAAIAAGVASLVLVGVVTAAIYQVSGTVKNQSSVPLSGAAVEIINPSDGSVVTSTTTDSDGYYTLSVSGGTYNVRVTPAAGSGFQTSIALNRIINGDTNLDFVLVPSGVAALSGRIIDGLGGGIPSQNVNLVPGGGGTPISTTTDSNGAYSFQVAPGDYNLQVNAYDYTAATNAPRRYNLYTVAFTLSTSTVADILLPAHRVTVHVQDPAGNAVPNTSINTNFVYADPLTIGPFTGYGYCEYPTWLPAAVTDSSGDVTMWLFTNSPSNPFTFTATPPSGSPYATTSLSGVGITGDSSITITLAVPVVLSGTIIDRLGGGIPSQNVNLVPGGGGTPISTTTDSNGAYSFQVAPGDYNLQVNAYDYTAATNAPRRYNLYTVAFTLSTSTVADIPLPAHRVTVHVQDPAGNAVPNTSINTNFVYADPLTIGPFTGYGYCEYPTWLPAAVTDSSGDVTMWLFTNSPSNPFTFTVTPPTGSPFVTFNVQNVNINSDKSLVMVLQFVHDPPVTTANLSPSPNGSGEYSNPTTVTLSATAFSGFTVASTYYSIDAGSTQTYTAPFTVSGGGPHTIRYWSVDNSGVFEIPNIRTFTINAHQLTALGTAGIWLGLKNSDDVGTKFDLLAEVLKNGALVGSGQLDSVAGGSSGFNNAVLRTINLALSSPVNISAGDSLSIRLSVRIAVGVTGHRSGTARLWFNDTAANSRFGATIGGATSDYFLLDGFTLGAAVGPGPKKTIDVFVDRAVGGNPFKPFGTWSKTF